MRKLLFILLACMLHAQVQENLVQPVDSKMKIKNTFRAIEKVIRNNQKALLDNPKFCEGHKQMLLNAAW